MRLPTSPRWRCDVTAIIDGTQLRTLLLGTKVDKATGTITVGTKNLFTVAGGRVLVTSITGVVTTAITVAGTTKLQANPTTGTAGDLCAATDLGTTDSPAGDGLSITGVPSDSIGIGIGFSTVGKPIAVHIGTIDMVTATGADGAITWSVTWIPLDDGATLVAA